MRPPARSTLASFLGFIFWLGLCYAAAYFGSHFGPGEWYAHLSKPSFNPPDWLFAPVWTILYFLMGVAAFLVWHRQGSARAFPALAFFLVQLALNAGWSWIFFGLHKPGAALVEIGVLWLAILATLVAFARLRRAAGLLLVPYLLWVSFAAYLNFRLWRLNP
jgi:tryptophan-rich sensory protein